MMAQSHLSGRIVYTQLRIITHWVDVASEMRLSVCSAARQQSVK